MKSESLTAIRNAITALAIECPYKTWRADDVAAVAGVSPSTVRKTISEDPDLTTWLRFCSGNKVTETYYCLSRGGFRDLILHRDVLYNPQHWAKMLELARYRLNQKIEAEYAKMGTTYSSYSPHVTNLKRQRDRIPAGDVCRELMEQ